MNPSIKAISESSLKTDLNELAHSLVHELAQACKKMGIYGPKHPLSQKAVEKPFLLFARVFGYKRLVNLNLQKGQLYLLNIRLKDTIFTAQVIQYMQILDINAVLFRREMSMDEFTVFVQRFVTRVNPNDRDALLAEFLKQKGIASIEVNSQAAFDLFEMHKQYRGDVMGDFSVKRLSLDQLGSDLDQLVKVRKADENELLEFGIDFNPEIVRYILPEKIASLPYLDVRARLMDWAAKYKETDNDELKSEYMNALIRIMRLAEDHPDHDKIVEQLDQSLQEKLGASSEAEVAANTTGQIKIESARRTEDLLDDLFKPEGGSDAIKRFSDAYARLLKTGQRPKAEEITGRMLGRLIDPDPGCRQKALNVLLLAVEQINPLTDASLLKFTVDTVIARLDAREETYEYSELIWQLFEKCRQDKAWEHMAAITGAMAKRRQIEQGITVYDSMAVKKAFENIDQRKVIDGLVDELTRASFEVSNHIKDILIAIGSENIALRLSEIISHPERNVRQQALRILAELGKASLRVFSEILMDDSWFERDSDRHELPDAKWYVLRNSIFVLGSLKDIEGVVPLRLRMTDNDVRIRREIIASLEKIGGEEAVDLLVLMADDPVAEIRQKAIYAVGLVGSPESAPMLVDVARRNPSEATRVVGALGRVGGEEARSFLSDLLKDESALVSLAGGKVAKEDLRLAIVKALGSIGDHQAIDTIKQYRDSLSKAQRLLFKNSPVQKAISDILAR